MNPLTTFPDLLTFGLFAPTLLRLSVAVVLILVARERMKKSYAWLAVLSGISALFIILGLYTQIAAIIGIIALKLDFLMDGKRFGNTSWEIISLYGLAILILLSLLFTGPGFFAFDLPL